MSGPASGPRRYLTDVGPTGNTGTGSTGVPAHSGRLVLKVATYNIHSCIDTARTVDMDKTARVIAGFDPDVVALQEVDAHKQRTGNVYQAKWLAKRLKLAYRYYPVIERGTERYGLAVLAKLPMKTVKSGRLPALPLKRPREVRGAMWVRLDTPMGAVNLIELLVAFLQAFIFAILSAAFIGDAVGEDHGHEHEAAH